MNKEASQGTPLLANPEDFYRGYGTNNNDQEYTREQYTAKEETSAARQLSKELTAHDTTPPQQLP